ncbi:hypothetical protein [Butyricicoccus sp. AF35-5AC]|uniref:hypothetical protein n=1 Tax=Butyricicoccus sp. AF35-5AC TaxID=2292003 RepID=UPI001A9A5699|nr:hypothetical protein [Butyricicoccus sp. AF35-5AC]
MNHHQNTLGVKNMLNEVLYVTCHIVRCSQRDSGVSRDVIEDVAVTKRRFVNQDHIDVRDAIV